MWVAAANNCSDAGRIDPDRNGCRTSPEKSEWLSHAAANLAMAIHPRGRQFSARGTRAVSLRQPSRLRRLTPSTLRIVRPLLLGLALAGVALAAQAQGANRKLEPKSVTVISVEQ